MRFFQKLRFLKIWLFQKNEIFWDFWKFWDFWAFWKFWDFWDFKFLLAHHCPWSNRCDKVTYTAGAGQLIKTRFSDYSLFRKFENVACCKHSFQTLESILSTCSSSQRAGYSVRTHTHKIQKKNLLSI